jgi:hypothetical protein
MAHHSGVDVFAVEHAVGNGFRVLNDFDQPVMFGAKMLNGLAHL